MALTGNEILYVIGIAGNGALSGQTEAVTTAGLVGVYPQGASALTLTNTAGFQLTAAQFAGASDIVIILSGTLAAGANVQLPTVASVAALVPVLATNASGYNVKIVNASSANFAWTVTTATGWTLSGTMTIAQNTTRSFTVQFASATAATLTTTGTGTYS